MTAVIQLKPEGKYANKDLDNLVAELKDFVHQQEVMHTKEAAKFLGISDNKLYRMSNIPAHRVPGISGKVYLRSELLEYIKKH